MRAPPAARGAGFAGFEILEHPADAKLRARGATLEELFAHAAEGLMSYLFGGATPQAQPGQTETIRIDAPDLEALLVDWLSELLYRATAEHRAYVDFRIIEICEHKLIASARTVSSEAIDDIKAITHHELSIRRQNGGWEASIVFDI
ncbi:archease [Bradyrhizobium hipponense]|uniref:Archease n=1 Tax=Bradyrhizobium hipponense TaxID=2605638 RepID=A0A5S4YNM0_9BRAD|nr:archease [Bradyrhizobium hipponense]TYO65107.1 archease [Bradyrhizobium hipponense]